MRSNTVGHTFTSRSCQIIGIILLHYVFRIITYLINRYTQLPQDILKHQFIKAIYQAYQDAEIKLLERTP